MESLTNLEELENAYSEICQQELQLETELLELTDNHTQLITSVDTLQKILPNLQLLESDAGQLGSKVSFTSTLAEGVSSKVRKLDAAKSRVSACVERVQDLLDLQQCTDGVQAAMMNDELEQAAAHVHRFRTLDENLLRVTSQFQDSSTLENSVKLLLEAETKLKTLVNSRFDAAVHQGDRASVERFFKIFPLLGLNEEGAGKFSKYLSAQISADSEKLVSRALSTNKNRAVVRYADALTVLFEEIARIVETHQPIFETYYGPGCLFVLLKHLQKECDRQARKIIEEFEKERNFSEKARLVLECLSSSSSHERLDASELDKLLGEVVLLSTRTDLYFRFFRRRVQADLETLNLDASKRDKKLAEVETFISDCELSSLLHDIVGRYIAMEEYFMREMCAKAVAMDTCDGDNKTSSMVDDTFFIIRKCVRRAISSSSVDGTCAMLNHANSALEQDLTDTLKARLRAGFPSGMDLSTAYNAIHSSFKEGRLQASEGDRARAAYLVTLNNIEACTNYAKTLNSTLQEDVDKQMTQASTQSIAKIKSCLSDLAAMSQQFKKLLDFGIEQLLSSVAKPRIKPLIDAFLHNTHNITENEFAQYEANDPWVQSCIFSLSSMIQTFQESLSEANYEQFLGHVTSEVTSQLERVVIKASFSRLGGLQFDRELRALVGYLTSLSTWSIRDRFSRLSQISTLLNLETIEELLDYWGSNSSITWRLTPAEVRQILTLRVEFRPDDIRKLKL